MAVMKNPPAHCAAELRSLMAKGGTKVGVANYFNVSVPTFNRWLEESEELRECFAAGREDERKALHNALYEKAMKGDGPAAMFLLKCKHNYREQGEDTTNASRISVVFNLPGAMKAEDYKLAQVIDGNASSTTKRIPESTS